MSEETLTKEEIARRIRELKELPQSDSVKLQIQKLQQQL